MTPKDKLKEILREFNIKGYADINSKYIDNGKNGKVLTLNIGDYRYEDEFYGGEPYSGNETIWKDNIDIFRCVYWGRMKEGVNFNDIYEFLRKSLTLGPDGDLVHRGPKQYLEGNFKYTNTIEGDIEDFRQIERIYLNEKEIYIAYFVGGRVNVSK